MTKPTPQPCDLTQLQVGDTVQVHCNTAHKSWEQMPPEVLAATFPATETVVALRQGPKGVNLAKLTNGFSYVLETSYQHPSPLSYLVLI